MSDALTAHAHLDPVLGCLCRFERRFVVQYLHERGGAASIDDLGSALAREPVVGGEAQTSDQIAQALRCRHLPQLSARDIVSVDGDTVSLRDSDAVDAVGALHEVCDELDVAPSDVRSAPAATYETYCPAEDRSLTDAVVTAVRRHRGEALRRTDFDFFEDVAFEALDGLFRADAEPRTAVALGTDVVRVELWGDEGVQLRVSAPLE